MGTNSTGCTEWERDFDPATEHPYPSKLEWAEFMKSKASRQRCTYCDREMIRRRAALGKTHIGLARTKDHVFPQSRGGRKTVPACYACNHAKADMAPEIWELFMADNPSWWMLEKKDLRKARKKAILATADFKRVAATIPPPSIEDHGAMRQHWGFIARCLRQAAAHPQS